MSAAEAAGADAAAVAPADGVAAGVEPAAAGAGAVPTTPATSVDHLVLGGGVAQRVGEVLLDQRAGQLGQQLQVGGVAAGGSGDEEGQVGRAVLGAEVDAAGSAGRRPSVATSTCAVRQCGIAMPPGSPVGEVDSRASASSARPDALALRPAARDDLGERPDHGGLVVPQVVVEPHERAVDQGSGHGGHLSSLGAAVLRCCGGCRRRDAVDAGAGRLSSGTGWTSTRSGRTWWGAGIVVPGSEAAALP